jgi:hypothetical protein
MAKVRVQVRHLKDLRNCVRSSETEGGGAACRRATDGGLAELGVLAAAVAQATTFFSRSSSANAQEFNTDSVLLARGALSYEANSFCDSELLSQSLNHARQGGPHALISEIQ